MTALNPTVNKQFLQEHSVEIVRAVVQYSQSLKSLENTISQEYWAAQSIHKKISLSANLAPSVASVVAAGFAVGGVSLAFIHESPSLLGFLGIVGTSLSIFIGYGIASDSKAIASSVKNYMQKRNTMAQAPEQEAQRESNILGDVIQKEEIKTAMRDFFETSTTGHRAPRLAYNDVTDPARTTFRLYEPNNSLIKTLLQWAHHQGTCVSKKGEPLMFSFTREKLLGERDNPLLKMMLDYCLDASDVKKEDVITLKFDQICSAMLLRQWCNPTVVSNKQHEDGFSRYSSSKKLEEQIQAEETRKIKLEQQDNLELEALAKELLSSDKVPQIQAIGSVTTGLLEKAQKVQGSQYRTRQQII